jgi:hypothetical protein
MIKMLMTEIREFITRGVTRQQQCKFWILMDGDLAIDFACNRSYSCLVVWEVTSYYFNANDWICDLVIRGFSFILRQKPERFYHYLKKLEWGHICWRYQTVVLLYVGKWLRNQVVGSLVWLWWVIDLVMFEFESGIILFCFFIFVLFGESRLLVLWCAGGRCSMTCSNEDRGRSMRPGAEDRGWSHWSGTPWPGGREVGWGRVRSTPRTWRLEARVSWLCLKTKVDDLWVVWPQNHSDSFC